MEELLCVQNELKCLQLPNIAPVCRSSELKCSQQRPNQSTGEGWSITWLTSHWGLKSVSWTLVPIAVWSLWIPEISESVSRSGKTCPVPFQIVPVCRKARELLQGQCQLCPCALRTEISTPVIISSTIYPTVSHRLFQQYGVLCKFWSVQRELGEWHDNWAVFCWQGAQRHSTEEQHWQETA